MGYTDGDPVEDNNHYIVEEEGPDKVNGVRQISFKQFKSGTYYGAMCKGYITKEKRINGETNIVDTAKGLVGLNYTSNWWSICVDWTDGYKDNPIDGILQRGEIHGLRSDAFVEYVYALNEIYISHDIINDTKWFNQVNPITKMTYFTPNDQYRNMNDATIDQPKPAHNLYSPSHDNAIGQWNDPQSKNPKIEVEWQSSADDDLLSGLHSYFVEWSQNKYITPTYYVQAEIVKAADGSAAYRVDSAKSRWPITDGKWWLHIRTVDKAGNWDEDNEGLLTTMHIGPFFIDTTPPNISISGITDGGTYTNPVTIQYKVMDKYLEPSSVTPNWGGTAVTIDPDGNPDYISGKEYIQFTAWKREEAPGNHIVTVSAKDKAGNSSTTMVRFTIQKTSDTPDDNESTSSPIPEAATPDSSAKIALLQRGFYSYSGELLNSLNEPFELIDTDFSASIVEEYPILIIPTGGLFGMENSDFFKAKLQQYVENGGRLVCFSQQRGYEFNALPSPSTEEGPAVSGYGWQEDQSCYYNALYVNKYHQILSGQSDFSITTSVDGYFTKWPDNSLSILNRTKNNMPALIMYDVGRGKVIATTSYLDWGYKNWQFSIDDKLLVRDMIGWLTESFSEFDLKQVA